MRRREGFNLTMALAVAGAFAGCDRGHDNGWDASAGGARVCVDQQGRRVAESECAQPRRSGGGVSPFLWYYLATLNRGAYAPGYGGMVSGGGFRPSPGVRYATPPPEGISRGGFGGIARGLGFGGERAGG